MTPSVVFSIILAIITFVFASPIDSVADALWSDLGNDTHTPSCKANELLGLDENGLKVCVQVCPAVEDGDAPFMWNKDHCEKCLSNVECQRKQNTTPSPSGPWTSSEQSYPILGEQAYTAFFSGHASWHKLGQALRKTRSSAGQRLAVDHHLPSNCKSTYFDCSCNCAEGEQYKVGFGCMPSKIYSKIIMSLSRRGGTWTSNALRQAIQHPSKVVVPDKVPGKPSSLGLRRQHSISFPYGNATAQKISLSGHLRHAALSEQEGKLMQTNRRLRASKPESPPQEENAMNMLLSLKDEANLQHSANVRGDTQRLTDFKHKEIATLNGGVLESEDLIDADLLNPLNPPKYNDNFDLLDPLFDNLLDPLNSVNDDALEIFPNDDNLELFDPLNDDLLEPLDPLNIDALDVPLNDDNVDPLAPLNFSTSSITGPTLGPPLLRFQAQFRTVNLSRIESLVSNLLPLVNKQLHLHGLAILFNGTHYVTADKTVVEPLGQSLIQQGTGQKKQEQRKDDKGRRVLFQLANGDLSLPGSEHDMEQTDVYPISDLQMQVKDDKHKKSEASKSRKHGVNKPKHHKDMRKGHSNKHPASTKSKQERDQNAEMPDTLSLISTQIVGGNNKIGLTEILSNSTLRIIEEENGDVVIELHKFIRNADPYVTIKLQDVIQRILEHGSVAFRLRYSNGTLITPENFSNQSKIFDSQEYEISTM